jgi:hypothetical protein
MLTPRSCTIEPSSVLTSLPPAILTPNTGVLGSDEAVGNRATTLLNNAKAKS